MSRRMSLDFTGRAGDVGSASLGSVLLFLLALLVGAPVLSGTALVWADETDESDPTQYNGKPIPAQEAFDEGEAAREEGRWDTAATAYWNAIEADLNHYRAHVRYQEAALKAGDDAQTMTGDYKLFISDWPKLACLKLHLLRMKPPADRLTALADVIKDDKKNFDAQLEVGRAHMALGNMKEALKPLEIAAALAPANRRDITLLLAETEYVLGKTKEARQRIQSAVQAKNEFFEGHLILARFDLVEGDYQKAALRADTVLTMRPTFLAAFLIRSEAMSRDGKLEMAIDSLKKAYRVTQEHEDITLALADLVAKQNTEKAYAEAKTYYEKVIAKDEENHRAYFGLAWLYERQEKWPEAEEQYREHVARKPDSVQGINSVGYCLFKQGRISEAQVQFKKATNIKKNYLTAMANLGATYDAQAKFGEAIKVYEKMLKMKGQKNNLRAMINCAFDYEALGTFNKALKLLKRAMDLRPDDANIIVWIGDNYYFQEKYKESVKWYVRATEMDEKSFFAWRGLGFAFIHQKKWEDAAEALEKASGLNEKDVDLMLDIGDIYMNELDDLESALKWYEQYISLGGNDPAVPEVIEEIKKELEDKKKK